MKREETPKIQRSPKVSRIVRKEKEIYFISLNGASPTRYFVETKQGRVMWSYSKNLLTHSEARLLLWKLHHLMQNKFKISSDD